eukprot:gb/GEZJ01004741.1/.p2 GENE.gb/GEZJ01004741.1/~~gb/GEZJ01004741.1/.p2  ORF type:complete len:105 (+),score=19.70 gb/GEZJ01004741.1/:82-396(+)
MFLGNTAQWKLAISSKDKANDAVPKKIPSHWSGVTSTVCAEIEVKEEAGIQDEMTPRSDQKSALVGNKRAHMLSTQENGLHRGADGIEELARAAKHRNYIAYGL